MPVTREPTPPVIKFVPVLVPELVIVPILLTAPVKFTTPVVPVLLMFKLPVPITPPERVRLVVVVPVVCRFKS